MGLLEGRVALITGSGRGIGAAAARLFAAEGAAVVVSDLDSAPAEETAEAIRRAGGASLVVAGDITDPLFPAALVQATLDAFGGVDILVNNAGFPWDSTVDTMTDQQWNAMLDVHATAPFRIVREAGRRFIREAARKELVAGGRARPRKVINVSSVAALYGNAGQVNYGAAKAAIIGLTKSLAREWGGYNVQVNCAVFGFVETRLTAPKDSSERLDRDGRAITLGIPPQMRQLSLLRIPLGRLATPEEAAGPLLFLASPWANYVSGSVLEVTGGFVP